MAATDDTRTQRPKTGATFTIFRTFCLLTAMMFLNHANGQVAAQTSVQRLEQMALTLNTSFVTPLLNTLNGQVDLIFILDRSASIGWYNGAWDSMLQFVENILYEFSVNSVHTRVSIITYSTTVSVDVDYLSDGSASSRLTKCKLNDDIEKRLRNKALHGWTATTTALERAKQVILTSRPTAKKAIFLLTDGRSNIGQPPSIPAREIANLRWSGWDMTSQGKQVEIFALGIEDAVEAELRSIASPSQQDHYFLLDNFQDFSLLARLLHGDQQEEFWSVTDRSYCNSNCGSHSICSCPSKSGYATCSCEEGYGGDGHLCTACPVGTYKDTLSPTDCTTCPEGTTTMGTGATSRDHCVCGEGMEERNGTCAARSCPMLPAVQHASMVQVNGRVVGDVDYNMVGMQQCQNTPGNTCYIRCDTGYRASGEHSLYCNTSFVWEGTLPTCNVVTCGPYPNVSDSTVAYNHSASGPYTYNSTLEIMCDAGRTPLFDTVRTCLKNGLWSGARATTYCKSVECPNLEVPAYASVSPPECGYRKHPHGTQCNVTCSEGFELRGGAVVQTCGTGDRWSHHGSTLTCRDVQPPTLECPPDILTYSDPGMNSTLLHWVVRPTTLTDNDGTVPSYTVHPNHPNPHHFDVGVHVLFYSATDTYGLTSQCQRHIRVENDKPPTLLFCPDNMEVTVQSASGHALSWADPVYVDDNNQSVPVECTANKGQIVSLGSHNVYCWAQNFPRNNRCKFTITLLPPACEAPDPPRNGVAVCGSISNFQQYCTVRCNDRYDFAVTPADAYTCDYSGNWHGSPFPWPDCSGQVRPGRATQKNDLYYYHGNCAENIDEIKQGFLQLYNTLTSSDCSAVNPDISCNVTDIEVECGITFRKRRDVNDERMRPRTKDHSVVKRQAQQQANLKIFFVIVAVFGDGGDVLQHDQAAITTALDDLYFEIGDKVENKTFDLPLGNETLETLHYTGFLADFELNCAPGQLAKIENYGASCVNCPVGTYGNGTACVPCAVGWYQDEETQTQCKQCPAEASTLSEGSRNSTDCKGFCQPGMFSDTGLEDCSPCDIGFYQPERNATTCLACPDSKSTVGMNSTSPDQCISHCLAGHFSPTGLQPCEPCPLNTYNPNPGRRSCVDCPGTQETFFLGASSPNDCFVNDNCHSDPCRNGATCEDLVGGYLCHCAPGYNGTDCEQDLDDCASNPCNNNGTCQDLVNGFNCTCVSGYTGDTCQMEVNECASSPCQHGGTCIDLFNTYQCYCLPGYTGHSCEQEINECDSSPCLSGASCVDEVDGYRCECPPGFAGDHCNREIDECQSQPCQNGGTCNDQVNQYNCSCVEGWSGAHCEVNTDDCQGVTCQNGGTCHDRLNDFVCECLPSYSGKTCQQVNPADFDLVFTKTTTADYAMFRAEFLHNLPQFTLCTWLRTSDTINTGTIFSYASESNFLNRDNTLTLSDPAHLTMFVNGEEVLLNVAVNDGLWHHVCVSWVSAGGSWEFYLDGTLQNSGTGLATGTQVMGGGVVVLGQDQDSLGGNFHPREAYQGELTRLNLYDDKLSAGDVGVLASSCVDRTSGTVLAWGDFRPAEVLHGDLQPRTPSWCLDTNECQTSGVCSGRECQDTRGSYQCTCPKGWTGQNCDVNINECSSSPCANGVCTDGINGYTCNCTTGYTGRNCNEMVNPCEVSPCQNGGTCRPDAQSFTCSCIEPSIMNEVCEYETQFCDNNPCQNSGTCLNLRDGYTCTCPTGFGETNCSLSIGPCDSSPCYNNGTCSSYQGGFQCSCPPLYIGSQCQVYNNPCVEGQSPCLNNGTCNPANNGRGYECVCQSPETQGENCEELLPCAVAQKQAPPCQNNGTCVNNGTGYLCDCLSGFNGDLCDIVDHCASTPCINGGSCVLESDGYSCRCTEPAEMDANCRYLGTTPAPTPCDPNPCLHGGHCETQGSNFVCRCAVKHEGLTCNKAYELYDTTVRLNLAYTRDLRTPAFEDNFIKNFQKMFRATGLPGEVDVTEITDVRSGSVIVDFTAKHSILANETRPDVNTMKQAMEDQLSTGRMGDLAANKNGFAMSIQGVVTTTTPKITPAPRVADNTIIIIIVVVLVCLTVIVVVIVAAVVRTRKQKRKLPPTPTANIGYQNKAFRGSRDSGIMPDINNQSMLPGQRFDQHIYEDLKEFRIDHYAESEFVPKTEFDNAVNQSKSAKSRRDLPPVPASPQYTDMSGASNTIKQPVISEEYVMEDQNKSTYQDLKPSDYQGLVKPHINQQVRKRTNSSNDHSIVYQNEAFVNDEILPSPPPGSKIVYENEDDIFEGALPSTRL
ncbi:NOTCH2 [Branchiostoma lanceolatum]|uniref:NOTCH2 protein n=1 Tax=Branchiostoma lanceolatum TaxID=7740 RepID=A0A8K0A631_BRALA|nr:NOTCH2 [Branchiostoma lanceolatum]